MKESTFSKYCLVIDEWFVNGFNGTKAYQKFYTDANDNAADIGFREIYGNLRIENYIKSKYQSSQITLKTSHEAILNELYNWAYSDITETILLTPEQVKELPIELRRLITKFKHTKRDLTNNEGKVIETVNTMELWFVSKEKAMEMIHRHIGFYEKDNSQKNLTFHITSKNE